MHAHTGGLMGTLHGLLLLLPSRHATDGAVLAVLLPLAQHAAVTIRVSKLDRLAAVLT